MINRVLTNLYQGNYEDISDNKKDFKWIFAVADVPKYTTKMSIYNLKDGENTLNNKQLFLDAIHDISHRIQNSDIKRKIAIHCHAGISRSPAVVVGILIDWGFTFDDAYIFAQEKMPQMLIGPMFIKWLIEYETYLNSRNK